MDDVRDRARRRAGGGGGAPCSRRLRRLVLLPGAPGHGGLHASKGHRSGRLSGSGPARGSCPGPGLWWQQAAAPATDSGGSAQTCEASRRCDAQSGGRREGVHLIKRRPRASLCAKIGRAACTLWGWTKCTPCRVPQMMPEARRKRLPGGRARWRAPGPSAAPPPPMMLSVSDARWLRAAHVCCQGAGRRWSMAAAAASVAGRLQQAGSLEAAVACRRHHRRRGARRSKAAAHAFGSSSRPRHTVWRLVRRLVHSRRPGSARGTHRLSLSAHPVS